MVEYKISRDPLSSTFAALADPTRRAILSRLMAGECSVGEIAQPFRMSLPAVSKHLSVLRRAGLIVRGRRAQVRPCKLNAAQLHAAVEWLEQYRRFWEESFDRLGEHLKEMKRECKGKRAKTHYESKKAKRG
jgi:DNA-binding transcriptional ArsR family regulator